MDTKPEKKIDETNISEEQADKRSLVDTAVMAFFFGGLLVAIIAGFARFYFVKSYDFFIETPCDPESELCFTRDCSGDECPPNGFDNYKQYIIPASAYDNCEVDFCETVCETSGICTEIVCDVETEECIGPGEESEDTEEAIEAEPEDIETAN